MGGKGVWMWTSLVLVCALILASYAAIYYYNEYLKYQALYEETLEELKRYSDYMFINILIDYGNGTKEWHNGTLVSRGATLFDATRIIAELNYTKYSFGIFITSINGVGGDLGYYWVWYTWNSTSGEWEFGPVGCDSYILSEGETLSWVYTKF
ncbi:MAG: hypothetical protein AYL31_007420 [Candidatus Bathyarchaeota archaeon B26-1]|nr:MAG: hypothetical protein AYL31_007420 [Candidatus Bathyarchaeota archaeon B26-1]